MNLKRIKKRKKKYIKSIKKNFEKKEANKKEIYEKPSI